MGHGLRRVAAQCGGLRAKDHDMEARYDAKGVRVRPLPKKFKKHDKHDKHDNHHGRQSYGFPDMTDWMNKHPGTTEWNCEFCGIYTASKPCCNRCESDNN